jgi:hypothetical protein
MSRIRIGFGLTIIMGAIWASAGLFESLQSFATGVIVSMVGLLGFGACDYIEYRRDEDLTQGRDRVWERRACSFHGAPGGDE